jgi:hypothetical protein
VQALAILAPWRDIRLLFLSDISLRPPIPVVDLSILEQSPLIPIPVVNLASLDSLFEIPVAVIDPAVFDIPLQFPVAVMDLAILDSFLDPPILVKDRYVASQGQAQDYGQPEEAAKNHQIKCLDRVHVSPPFQVTRPGLQVSKHRLTFGSHFKW